MNLLTNSQETGAEKGIWLTLAMFSFVAVFCLTAKTIYENNFFIIIGALLSIVILAGTIMLIKIYRQRTTNKFTAAKRLTTTLIFSPLIGGLIGLVLTLACNHFLINSTFKNVPIENQILCAFLFLSTISTGFFAKIMLFGVKEATSKP